MEQEQIVNDDDRGGSTGGSEHGASRGSTRPPGTTTSAMVRDAARLRTVMTRAARHDDADDSSTSGLPVSGTRTELHGGGTPAAGELAIGIPLPDLAAIRQPGNMADDMAIPAAGPDHQRLESTGYGATRLIQPQADAAGKGGANIADPAIPRDGATRLRPVASLNTIKPQQSAIAGAAVPLHAPAASAGAHGMAQAQPATSQAQQPASHADVWDAATTATTPRVASDSWSDIPRENRWKEKGGFKKGLAAACTVLAGSVIGIGLYAGGGGFLSGIFSNKTEGVQTMSPSTVTERPQVAVLEPIAPAPATIDSTAAVTAVAATTGVPLEAVPTPSVQPALSPVMQEPPIAERTRPVQAAVRNREKPSATNVAVTSPSRPATVAAESGRNGAASGSDTKPSLAGNGRKERAEPSAASGTKAETARTPAKYVVQVRATPDESEANLVAKKLRKKGVANVQVVRSQKNGAPFYRVRFVGSGSSGAVRDKAKGAGFADVWVVKQE